MANERVVSGSMRQDAGSAARRSHAGEAGQTLLAVVIFFTIITATVILGITLPIVRQLEESRASLMSAQSYFTGESLAEDLAYRLMNGKPTAASETLSLASTTATANITSDLNKQTVYSTGNDLSFERSVTMVLAQGTGIAFNYGTQTGNGGFILHNNAGVNGNAYSNGNISGDNGAFVTGTAVAADSVTESADQTNDSPLPPPAAILFGNANASQDLAQSFQISTAAPANSASFYIEKIGSPGSATVRLVADSSGKPGGATLASAALPASQVTASYGWVTIVFPSGVWLAAGTTYWLVIDASASAANYYQAGANAAYPGGTALVGNFNGSWNATSPAGLDAYFRFYIGGQTATINDVRIGQAGSGDAWAHAVTGSTIAGGNYCQTGSGNNKACNTTKGDPSPQPFPVSDGNIADWKTAAAAGTVIPGDVSIGTTTSLGPAEITGNLLITGTLNLTGVVYVKGTIEVSNNGKVKLDPSFGARGSILLSDGTIRLSNNVVFSGTGDPSSYVMLLTTSDCPISPSCGGSYAIEVSNNAGTVIINAQKGTVHVSNNAGANEITAYQLVLDNNATVTYQSGLASSVFTTGPAGGYQIGSWKETQ